MKLKCFASLIVLMLVLLITSCPDNVSNSSSGLYDIMRLTVPCIEKGKAINDITKSLTGRSVLQSDPVYPLFYIFQDYVYPADEGLIDSGNLYKLLYESSGIYSNRKQEAHAITPSQIASPFDFGNVLKTYDHAFNSIGEQGGNYDYTLGYQITGDDVSACYGYTVRESVTGGTKVQRQIYETSFNEIAGNMTLDFCTFDDKPIGTSEDFGRRAFVQGNMLDHSFFIHFVTGNVSSVTSIVGKGISQGTGYYILCSIGTVSSTYYKLPAGATESDFETATGVTDIAQLDDPEGYAAALVAYTQTAAYTTRCGIPTSLSTFTNDGLLVLP